MPVQKLARDTELGADLANLIFIKRGQRLDDPARLDQLLNSGNSVVMGLDDIRSRGAARFDGVGIDGSLPENPVAVQKMASAQHALLHGDELFADDVPFPFRIANTRQRVQKLTLG